MLEAVLRTERDGFEFYTMAAETSGDSGAKDVRVRRAEEERRQFDALQTEYWSILDGAGWNPDVVLGERFTPQGSAVIFSEDFRRRIGGRHLEISRARDRDSAGEERTRVLSSLSEARGRRGDSRFLPGACGAGERPLPATAPRGRSVARCLLEREPLQPSSLKSQQTPNQPTQRVLRAG